MRFTDFLKTQFWTINFMFSFGVFVLTVFCFSFASAQLYSLPSSVFGEKIIVQKDVLEKARKELQDNLLGAQLTKENRQALNSQLFEVGLYVDEESNVQIYKEEEYAKLKRQQSLIQSKLMKIALHKAYLGFLKNDSNFGVGTSKSFLTEENSNEFEEEEEEAGTYDYESVQEIPDYIKRVNYRQKMLMRYILVTLDEGLRTDPKYKGKRVAGSEYIQSQLKKYSK